MTAIFAAQPYSIFYKIEGQTENRVDYLKGTNPQILSKSADAALDYGVN